jgi:hypothetical protein
VVWLPLVYNPDNRAGAEVRYGLLDPDGTERPAGAMLAGLAEAARGARATPIDQDGLAGVAFGGRAGTAMVVWSNAAPVAVKLPARSLARRDGCGRRCGGFITGPSRVGSAARQSVGFAARLIRHVPLPRRTGFGPAARGTTAACIHTLRRCPGCRPSHCRSRR